MYTHDHSAMTEDTKHHTHSHHASGMGHMHHMQDFKKRFIISLIVTIPILLFSPSIQQWFGFSLEFPYKDILIALLSSFIYLYGGKPFLTMMADEIRSAKPGMMTLISMATSVAYFYSLSTLFWYVGKAFFWELATLIDIMLIGHYIEAKSLMGASSALNELVKLMPNKAVRILNDGEFEEVSVDQLQKGDLILVRPGEKISADGMVTEGESMNDEAFLTGESKPVYKKPGSSVYMGGTNLDGALRIEITKSGQESYLSQVITLVEEASRSRSRTQDLANRAAGWLFYLAVSVAAVTFAVWAMLTSSSDAVLKSVTVLIIACPHALGLAVPLVTAISTSLGAQHGILIRNRQAFELLGKVDVICFDKTGTITEGKLSVENVAAVEEEEKVLYYAASLERSSEHSIARAIVLYAESQGVLPGDVTDFVTYPGIGAKGWIEGKEIMVGGMQLLEKESLDIPQALLKNHAEEASKVWVVVDGRIVGVILLTDTIRKNAAHAIGLLKKLGISTYMLTGDSEAVASAVAKKTGISRYRAGLLPDEKLQHIAALQKEGKVVAMVGDGINDAPALLSADIGIAIGAGTDIAMESADIILTKSELLHVTDAIVLSQKTYIKMVQNLWWASGYNIIAVPLAAGVLSPVGIIIEPALGAILMSISTVVVALNAQLLKGALTR